MFVTLFNLQGAHRSELVAAGFNDNTSFSLCQELFSSFFKLFRSSFIRRLSRLSRAGFAADSIRLPHSVRFVKNFFQVFQTFFKLSNPRTLWAACVPDRFCPVAERLLILAKPPQFVNTFFYFFPPFFPLSFPQPYLRLYPPFPPQDVHFSTLFSTVRFLMPR